MRVNYLATGIILLAFLSQFSFAQITNAPVSLPSPNASQFGRYGDVPVSPYTGAVQFNVPIYTVNSGSIGLPLSVNYMSGGVKPDEHPGWAGLGWNLRSGGVITRTMKDEADDNNSVVRGVKMGYRWTGSILKNNNWYTTNFLIDSVVKSFKYQYDTEPDEYSFNFLNYSGKFYLDENAKIQVRCDQKIKVELFSEELILPPFAPPTCVYNNNRFPDGYLSSFRGFIITAEDGVKYYFGNTTNAIEYSIPFFEQHYWPWTANSRYLTRIVDPRGKEIKLNYKRGPYISQMYISIQMRTSATGGNDVSTCSSYSGGYPDKGIYSGKLVSPVYLSSITSGKDSIVFYNSPSIELKYYYEIYKEMVDFIARLRIKDSSTPSPYQYLYFLFKEKSPCSDAQTAQDVISSALEWRRLDSIAVFNSEKKRFKSFEFKYNSTGPYASSYRLMLLSVQEKTSRVGARIPPYKFSYYTNPSRELGEYLHFKTDHWGFFNGKIPGFIGNLSEWYGKKEPDSTYLKEGSLSSITYPTGGVTVIEYEPHFYSKQIDTVSLTNLTSLPSDKMAGGYE